MDTYSVLGSRYVLLQKLLTLIATPWLKTLVSNYYNLLNWTLAVCGWVALYGHAQHQKIGRMSLTPANLQNPSPLVQNSVHRCGGVSDYSFFIGRCRAIVLRGQ